MIFSRCRELIARDVSRSPEDNSLPIFASPFRTPAVSLVSYQDSIIVVVQRRRPRRVHAPARSMRSREQRRRYVRATNCAGSCRQRRTCGRRDGAAASRREHQQSRQQCRTLAAALAPFLAVFTRFVFQRLRVDLSFNRFLEFPCHCLRLSETPFLQAKRTVET